MNTVNFHTHASGCIELCAESADNYWIIRFNTDGTQTLLRNMQPVDSFPKSKLTRDLDKAAATMLDKIRGYMAAPSNDAYWAIRDQLATL